MKKLLLVLFMSLAPCIAENGKQNSNQQIAIEFHTNEEELFNKYLFNIVNNNWPIFLTASTSNEHLITLIKHHIHLQSKPTHFADLDPKIYQQCKKNLPKHQAINEYTVANALLKTLKLTNKYAISTFQIDDITYFEKENEWCYIKHNKEKTLLPDKLKTTISQASNITFQPIIKTMKKTGDNDILKLITVCSMLVTGVVLWRAKSREQAYINKYGPIIHYEEGMINLNWVTCFFNAGIQALAGHYSSQLEDAACRKRGSNMQSTNPSDSDKAKERFLTNLSKLVNQAKDKKVNKDHIVDTIKSLKDYNNLLNPNNRQQDAQEYLNFILDEVDYQSYPAELIQFINIKVPPAINRRGRLQRMLEMPRRGRSDSVVFTKLSFPHGIHPDDTKITISLQQLFQNTYNGEPTNKDESNKRAHLSLEDEYSYIYRLKYHNNDIRLLNQDLLLYSFVADQTPLGDYRNNLPVKYQNWTIVDWSNEWKSLTTPKAKNTRIKQIKEEIIQFYTGNKKSPHLVPVVRNGAFDNFLNKLNVLEHKKLALTNLNKDTLLGSASNRLARMVHINNQQARELIENKQCIYNYIMSQNKDNPCFVYQREQTYLLPNFNDKIAIQLKRMVHSDPVEFPYGRKIQAKIDSPLNLTLHTSNYSLDSGVIHYGNTLTSGHYIAVRKIIENNQIKWLYCNDRNITTITEQEAKQILQDAYLLFYTKNRRR